jgi:hypothetical protein
MAKYIKVEAKGYDENEQGWEVSIPIKGGKVLVIDCGLDDMERIHSTIRQALQDESLKKLKEMEART